MICDIRVSFEIEHSLAVQEGQVICDIRVSLDGTHTTRGDRSKVGVPTVTGCESGKVLNTGSRSKLGLSCDHRDTRDPTSERYRNRQAAHADVCTWTHDVSSGGDVDSFQEVFDESVYRDNHPVEKTKCLGHVQKRMGSRLRRLRAQCGKRQLAVW